MRTKKEINLIYKHTHRDYKSDSNGVKKVMYLENGVTTLGPIETMPEEEYQYKLNRARTKESQCIKQK